MSDRTLDGKDVGKVVGLAVGSRVGMSEIVGTCDMVGAILRSLVGTSDDGNKVGCEDGALRTCKLTNPENAGSEVRIRLVKLNMLLVKKSTIEVWLDVEADVIVANSNRNIT